MSQNTKIITKINKKTHKLVTELHLLTQILYRWVLKTLRILDYFTHSTKIADLPKNSVRRRRPGIRNV